VAYHGIRARLTLERGHLQAQLIGASPRSRVWGKRAPDAGCSRRWRASATFPVPYQRCPTVRRALDEAGQEARALGHDYIGTEHVLLALVSADGGVAACR
jgi:ClpA/ClpB-like protein